MKLEKAIEILTKAQEATVFVGEHPLRRSQQLGIEALKRVEAHRSSSLQDAHILLPGETKE